MRKFSSGLLLQTEQQFNDNLEAVEETSADKNLDDLSFNEVSRLIYLHERAAISYRSLLENREFNDDELSFKSRKIYVRGDDSYLQDLPVDCQKVATEFGDLLCVFTPYTFKRGSRDSYNLAIYINAKLESIYENDKTYFELGRDKKLVYVIRCVENYNRSRHRDNDNMETTEIINAIFSQMLMSDNAKRMSFLCDFIETKNENLHGMYFIVTPYTMPLMHGEEIINLFNFTK